MAQKTPKKTEGHTLHDLLLLKLQSLYDVEQELVKALPKMARAATNPQLKKGFEDHERETKGHVERLTKAFTHLEEKPKALKSEAIRGLIEDAQWVISEVEGPAAVDAALIAAAQYVEHYEIAGYGTAREWAELMKHEDVERLLSETLEEEKQTDAKLKELAMTGLNSAANSMEEK